MRIIEIIARAHATARDRGWYDGAPAVRRDRGEYATDAAYQQAVDAWFAARLMLVVSEVSEALEAYRERGLDAWTEDGGKPCGVASELADTVIRVADLCGEQGIDLARAIEEKMAFNATRPTRHGGKKL